MFRIYGTRNVSIRGRIPQHKNVRYLIQMYIDVAGGVTKDTPFVMSLKGYRFGNF